MSAYCDVAPGHPYHGPYHDRDYGFPLLSDDELFERLILEINQAGLNWLTILKKRESFRRAYAGFSIAKVARFTARDRQRLMRDPGVIRNRLKIEAAIENARRIQAIQQEQGSFAAWLDAHHARSKEEWVKLFKQTFRFTGGEIVGEFLLSTGYLPGAHKETCPIYPKIVKSRPAWLRTHPKLKAAKAR